MTKRYIFEDPKNEVVVGYDCRIPLAEEMAKYTAKTYKGKLYEENEEGKLKLIKDFTYEEKKHKRKSNKGV